MNGDSRQASSPIVTLRLSPRIVATPVLAAAIVALTLGGAEVLVRFEPVAAGLPAPSTGSPNLRLEYKLASLASRGGTGNRPDCFFVGSSMVDNGVDPTEFGRARAETSRGSVDCFNIGAAGVTASGGALIAEYLAIEFHPKLIVYGTTLRDFVPHKVSMTEQRLNTPWFRYQHGEFSLQGWLTSRSASYGVVMTLRNWMKPGFAEHLRAMRPSSLDTDGYPDVPSRGHDLQVDLAAEPDGTERSRGQEVFSRGIDASELRAIARLAAVSQRGARVVVVEMPLHPTYFSLLPGGRPYYDSGMERVGGELRRAGLEFLPLSLQPTVSTEGWYDRNHLNGTGADRFSAWLGSHLGDAAP